MAIYFGIGLIIGTILSFWYIVVGIQEGKKLELPFVLRGMAFGLANMIVWPVVVSAILYVFVLSNDYEEVE